MTPDWPFYTLCALSLAQSFGTEYLVRRLRKQRKTIIDLRQRNVLIQAELSSPHNNPHFAAQARAESWTRVLKEAGIGRRKVS